MQLWTRMLVPSLVLVTGCLATAPDAPPGAPPGDSSQPIQIAPSCADGYPGAPFVVSDARVVGDLLELQVSFSGGCRPHEFFACWRDGAFLESMPVMARLAIFHEDNGDMCEAYLSETHHIDLGALRDAYRSGYGQGGTIALQIDGTEHGLEYTFSD